jgi:hypothetical protein
VQASKVKELPIFREAQLGAVTAKVVVEDNVVFKKKESWSVGALGESDGQTQSPGAGSFTGGGIGAASAESCSIESCYSKNPEVVHAELLGRKPSSVFSAVEVDADFQRKAGINVHG